MASFTIIRMAAVSAALVVATGVTAVYAAPCENGQHTGNPHCQPPTQPVDPPVTPIDPPPAEQPPVTPPPAEQPPVTPPPAEQPPVTPPPAQQPPVTPPPAQQPAVPSTLALDGSAPGGFVWMWHLEANGWEMRSVPGAVVGKRLAEGDLVAYDNPAPDGTRNTNPALRPGTRQADIA